jgi:hypothetical protein
MEKFLKGVYDEHGRKQSMLVTGSARLDTFRKSGDALTGRFYHYRLHPVDLPEPFGISTLTVNWTSPNAFRDC